MYANAPNGDFGAEGTVKILKAFVAALALTACGAPAAPVVPPASSTSSEPAARATSSTTFWDVRGRARLDERAFVDRVAGARVIVLGEKHDDPVHHRLEAEVLRAVYARGARPALVFEMVSTDAQPALDAFLATKPASADGLRAALGWDASGWPPWELYAPVFDAAVKAGAPILAGSPPRVAVMAIVRGDAPKATLDALAPFDATQTASLRDELREVHCGKLPEEMLDPMATAQRAKDAEMARHVLEGVARAGGAVLVAGAGHARSDRGVGWLLARAGERPVTVGMLEEPAPPRADLPYDLAVLSPPAGDPDPCRSMHAR